MSAKFKPTGSTLVCIVAAPNTTMCNNTLIGQSYTEIIWTDVWILYFLLVSENIHAVTDLQKLVNQLLLKGIDETCAILITKAAKFESSANTLLNLKTIKFLQSLPAAF